MHGKTWMIGALCAALLPFAALAQPGDAPDGVPAHFRGGMHAPDSALLQGVTLTSAQQTQIDQIHQAGWAQAKPLVQQLRTTKSQIETLLLAPGAVNTAQLTSLQQQATQLLTQLAEQRLSTELQVRGVLTSAQLAQAAATHTQVQALHQQMRSLTHPGAQNSTAQ